VTGEIPRRRTGRLAPRARRLRSVPLFLSLLVVLAVGVGVPMIAIGSSQPTAALTTTTCSTRSGGYWQVASDGGVFAFGGAGFYGSAANIKLNSPIVGLVPTSDAKGYWLIAADGGVFSYGDARFLGSMGGIRLNSPVVGGASAAASATCVGPAGAAGAVGNTILNGTTPPAADVGNDGDFYLDTATSTLYGPKASGVWPAQGTSLVGPAGQTGPNGATGATGATGMQGPAGPGAAVFTTSGIYSVPAGVSDVIVKLRGGGGGGGGADGAFPGPGSGGGEGASVEVLVPVTGGSQLTLTVGGGGAGGLTDPSSCSGGSSGGTSTVAASSSTFASAGGGGGGGCAFAPSGGAPGTVTVNSPATGIQEIAADSGSTSGAGGGPSGYVGSGGAGAPNSLSTTGGAGSAGLIEVLPAS